MSILQSEIIELINTEDSIFDFIQEASIDSFWYLDLVTKENQWTSPKFWKSLGYNPTETQINSFSWKDYVDKADYKLAIQNINKILANPNLTFEQTIRCTHKNGLTIWIECKGVAIKDKDGKPVKIIGIHTDITKTKAKELYYQSQIYRYQNIINGTGIGTWEWNIQTGETIYNQKWANIIGYSIDELSPVSIDTWTKFTHPEDLEKSSRLLEEHFKGKTPFYECEARMKHKNGSWVWVLDKGKVVTWTEDGKPEWMAGSHLEFTEIKKSIERNKLFIEQAPSSIAMFDSDFKFLAASQQWLTENNLSSSDLAGKSYIEIAPKSSTNWKIIHQSCLKGEILKKEEEELIKENGSIKWIKWEARPWYTDSKNLGGILLYTSDITESKLRAKEKQKIEDILDYTNEVARIGTWEVNVKNNTIFWSRITKEIHEVPLDFIPNLTTGINFYKEGYSRNKIKEVVQEAIEKGTSFDVELEIITAKNRSIWVRAIGQSNFVNGKCESVYGVFQDVDINRKSKEALNNANEELNALFDSAYVSIICTNTNGIITHFNKGAEILLQYKKEEIIGIHTPEIIHLEEELIHRGMDLSIANGKTISGFDIIINSAQKGEFDSREWTYVRKDGTTFPVQLVVTAIRNKKHEITGYLGVATDISEIKKAEHEIQDLLTLTKDQNNRLRNFAHIVSHNLRSHSNNFGMLLELFLNENKSFKDNSIIELLVDASENLKETISHLNEVVLINTSLNENLSLINLNKAIDSAILNVAGIAKEAKVQIINNVETNTNVLGISAYLDSIVLNFITNGIKYRSLERDSFIKLSIQVQAKYTVLSIEDNGKGIDLNKNKVKLFGMYKTFHGNKDAKGIGLFITKNQVEAMGGKIEVESEVNVGTTFKIFFKNEI